MSKLVLKGIGKNFGNFQAVDDFSLEMKKGEFVSLLGPSGCGKTTTLRMIAGFMPPTAGTIEVDGQVISSPAGMVPPERRRMSMIFQSYAIWPNMTVGENVGFGLEVRKLPRADIERRVDRILEVVQMGALKGRYPSELSGGQQQRVALARAIVGEPEVLLLDEPLSNLDAKLRIRLRDELRRILKQTGMTGLYVTHDQAEAVVLGDRIGVMKDGKLLQMAPPGEIYNRPADSFVANFTGASNVLTGKVLARSGERATIDLGVAGKIEAWTPQPLNAGDKARVALRAENVRLGERGPANVFSGKVIERRYQGMQTVYDVEMGGQRLEALELGTAARHEQNGEVAITLPPDTCWAYRDEGAVTD